MYEIPKSMDKVTVIKGSKEKMYIKYALKQTHRQVWFLVHSESILILWKSNHLTSSWMTTVSGSLYVPQ